MVYKRKIRHKQQNPPERIPGQEGAGHYYYPAEPVNRHSAGSSAVEAGSVPVFPPAPETVGRSDGAGEGDEEGEGEAEGDTWGEGDTPSDT